MEYRRPRKKRVDRERQSKDHEDSNRCRSLAARRRDSYLEQVRQAAQRLIDEGYLLAEDLELVAAQASRRYELLAAAREPAAVGE